ncbi:MAG: DMT family transporter [Archaeoglobaceae archaeon]|nr:DMT family transporter [Archaeoglobaceae archaeon]MDW8117363.1 EamA family transporter [Archaeoglobaceae archaeon]
MRGEFAILFSAILMGTISIFVRNTGSDPLFVAFLRLSFATIFLLPFLLLTKNDLRITKLHLALAVFNLLTIVSYVNAIQQIEAGTAALLLYTAPIYVLMIAILRGENIERKTLISLPIGLFGLYFMLFPYAELNFGLISGIISGISYSIVFALTKKAKHHSSFHITFFNVFFGALILLPYSLLNFSEFSIPWALGLGLIPTAIPFTLFIYGVKRVKLQKAPIIALIEPVFAILIGFLYFGEILSDLQILGGILVITATFLVLIEKTTS